MILDMCQNIGSVLWKCGEWDRQWDRKTRRRRRNTEFKNGQISHQTNLSVRMQMLWRCWQMFFSSMNFSNVQHSHQGHREQDQTHTATLPERITGKDATRLELSPQCWKTIYQVMWHNRTKGRSSELSGVLLFHASQTFCFWQA